MLYDLKMSDGSIVQTSMTGVSQQGELWIHAHNLSVVECAVIFSDTSKTQRMEVNYDPTMKDVFIGYIVLQSVSTCDDFIKVCLSKQQNGG